MESPFLQDGVVDCQKNLEGGVKRTLTPESPGQTHNTGKKSQGQDGRHDEKGASPREELTRDSGQARKFEFFDCNTASDEATDPLPDGNRASERTIYSI